MNRFMSIVSWLLPFVLLCNGAAWAQQSGRVELTLVAEQERQVITDKGEKELKRVPAAKVVPGDEVIYSIHYVNKGKEAADSVVIDNPVPEHMLYTQGSAAGADTAITFSVDKGKTYHPPSKLTVTGADGKERPATAADYTHIRWTLQKPLVPGGKGLVSFRARLK